MRVGPWWRWGRLLSSRSEASCSSSTVRFRLGSPLLPLLLGLPLVAGLGPTRAQAQVACTTANSDGSYDVPADWSLKPSGLASGARFRLLFVTSTTRDATATDIATYNTFVQDRAKAGHSAVTDSCGDLFKVVGSTLAVNARANTDSESTDTDAAIYWLNGAKAADNYADFYDGNWDSVAAKNESGNNPPSSVTFVWTGSGSDGVTAAGYLGRADNNVIRGRLDTNQPLSEGAIYYTTTQPFYGLSPVFKVDSGTPTLTISGPAAADEGDGDPMQRLFTVGLSSAVTGKVSYQVCFSGTAKLGSGSGSLVQDYRMESNGATVSNEEGCLSGLELAAGETGSGQDVGIAVLGDLFPEGDETVVATLSLEAAPEGVVLGTNMATHTIRNDDGSKATLTLPGATTSLVEGDGPAEFVLSGSGVTSGSSYYVQFGLGGTATNRTDYRIEVRLDGQWYDVTGTASSVWLDVGADVLPLRLRLVPLADERVEGEESAVLTLAAGEGYTSGTPSSVTFDVGERTVAVAAAAAVTEGEAAGFTLTASPAPKEDLPVTVQVRDSGDFASGGTGARTVTVGTTGTASFSVATTDDDTDEPNGTITATVNAGTGYAPHSTEGSASVTVNDNDVAPTVFWEFRGGGIAENSGTYTREAIQANRDLGSALTVNYSLSGTATCGTDYMITGADCTTGTGAFTLPANTTAFTGVPFPVTITPDDISDNGETIIVTLTAGNGYNISGEVSTFTIYDDTGTAAFSLSGRPQVGETLSIVKDSDDPDGNGSRSFNYVWQFRATSSDDWSDLAASQRGCGDTTTCTPTHSEEYPAVGGYFRGRASYVDGNGLGTGAYTNAVGPFTLPAPGIALPTADLALREGATASYNLKLATDPGDGATVRVSVTSGDTGAVTVNDTQSGVNGVQNYLDFTGGSGGSWNTHQAVAVAGVQDVDATSEADVALIHAVSVQAGASAPYTGLADRILNVDVRDDDAPNSAPAFASGTLTRSVAENAAAGANVGAAIPAATDRDGDALTYTLGGADADSFQFDGATRQITTREGVTYDNEVKSVYRVTVTAADNNGGRATVRVTITVLDAEELVASFGSATSSAGEDGGTQNVQVNLSPSPQVGMTLGYEVSGTATAGSDFSIANSGSVQVDANTASVTIPVTITEDTEAEEAETVILTLTGGSGYRVGSGNVHTLTINDNDDPGPATPVVSIGVSPSSMTEGETATFTLTASPAPTEDISVQVEVTDSGDFASGGTGPQTVTVDTSGIASFTIPTTDDETDEPNGTITATVNTGTGYAPHNTDGSASVTVNDNDSGDGDSGDGGGNDADGNGDGDGDGNGAGGDNDGADGADGATSPPVVPPTVSISRGRAVITEGDHAVFTLTASPAPREDLPVTVQVRDSGDFASGAGLRTVSIPPSGAASFTVPTMDDDTDEPNGTITATVNTGTGYAPHTTDGSASVTVNDNDDPGLRFSPSSLTVARGGSSSYTVSLSTRPSEPVTVSIRVPEGSGLTVDTDPGRDGNQTTLTFTADDWNVPQRVVVTVPEHPASITLTHTATGDHYGGVTARMTVRVADIDPDAVRGWHVRWGRTLSQQVVDALQDRFAAVPTPPGLHLRVAGEELSSAVPLAENRQVLAKALGFEKVTAEQLVQDSAFSFSPAGAEAARFALWGRGALSSFSGEQDTVSLEGEASTALVGAEWRAERWQAGAALSRSWGSGSYGGAHRGEVDTSGMTGLFPYGRYALTPRLGIWAVAGWGWGQLSLQPDGTAGEYQPWSKLSMTAVGLDGLLLDGGAEGLSLVSTAEVLRVRTVSEEVADLAGSEGIISRRRLELEATRAFPLSNGAALSPSLSLAVREDGGDGETGFGLEMGAGLLWADPARGVRGELQGRSLLSHVEEEFREQGLSLSFAWDPAPGNRGPSLSLSHAVGATAAGGMDALLQPVAIQVLDDAHGGQQQFAAELAYGVSAFADRFTLSPGVGLVLSPDGAVYSLGWALAPYAQQAQAEPWELALQGEREQRSATTSADHSLTLRFSLLF